MINFDFYTRFRYGGIIRHPTNVETCRHAVGLLLGVRKTVLI